MKKHVYSFLKIVFFLSVVFPFILAAQKVLSGNFPFWYDPARDFLLAWDNLSKLTLIGPTSGIPGLFYGPYWIWLLSLGLFFSHDPRFVVFLVLTIPYFIIFPFVLYQFHNLLGLGTVTLLWLFFIFMFGLNYATAPWNPYAAPLLYLILVYLITKTEFELSNFSTKRNSLLAGLLTGLIINFHISFGLGIFTGSVLFFIVYFASCLWQKRHFVKKTLLEYLLTSICFISGFLVTFLPFFIFESRHGWQQSQTVLHVLSSPTAVVSQQGLSKLEIIQHFFGVGTTLLHSNYIVAYLFISISVIMFLWNLKKGTRILSPKEKRLLLFVVTNLLSLSVLYLSYHNPVWDYHFIGVEVSVLFIIGILLKNKSALKILLTAWFVIFFLQAISSYITDFTTSPTTPVLKSKENIVKTIQSDAHNESYVVYAYSPSIYMYEYSYLFRWLAKKDVPYDPGQNPTNSPIVYLIIPPLTQKEQQGFINYRTSAKTYVTVNQWTMPDNSLLIKRKLIAF